MTDVVSATDSYLAFLLSLGRMSPITVLSAFFLTLARLIPSMVIAPFLGAKTVPAIIRMMFSVALCVVFLPQVLVATQHTIPFDMIFVGLMIKELFIGFIIGFLVTIPFYIAQSSGGLIDHIRGSASLQVTDPTTSSKTGPLGIFYNYSLIAIFFAIGGPIIFIRAVSQSFTLIPITEILNPVFFSPVIPFWKKIIGLVNMMFTIAIQLGAPSIIGVLMAEMFLGIANRLAPQVQIVFLGISLKSWLGLGLLAAAWYFIMNQLGKDSKAWIEMIQQLIVQTSQLKNIPK